MDPDVDDKYSSFSPAYLFLESLRNYFTTEMVMSALVKLMMSKNAPIVAEACRAIGNICFDNGM